MKSAGIGKKITPGKVKKSAVVLAAAAVLLCSGIPLWAQQTDGLTSIDELSVLLEEKGWSEEEVAALVEAAKGLEDWEDTKGADPEVVALALELGKNEDQQMEPLEQAHLALQLALTAVEMEAVGYNERSVARVALNGARDVVSEIKTWKQGGREGNLGAIVRNCVSAQLKSEGIAQVHEQAVNRIGTEHISSISFSNIPTGGDYTEEEDAGPSRK